MINWGETCGDSSSFPQGEDVFSQPEFRSPAGGSLTAGKTSVPHKCFVIVHLPEKITFPLLLDKFSYSSRRLKQREVRVARAANCFD